MSGLGSCAASAACSAARPTSFIYKYSIKYMSMLETDIWWRFNGSLGDGIAGDMYVPVYKEVCGSIVGLIN